MGEGISLKEEGLLDSQHVYLDATMLTIVLSKNTVSCSSIR